MKPTILTHSGHYFDLLDPDPGLIHIEDIAHALSNLCRFTGHTKQFYSVAQHSVWVSLHDCVKPECRLEALLHDAAEAYVGDVVSPLKALLPDYKKIERGIDQAIRQRFGLPAEMSPCVKQADLSMLATEKLLLMPPTPDTWPILEGVEPVDWQDMPDFLLEDPWLVEKIFLDFFNKFTATGAATK